MRVEYPNGRSEWLEQDIVTEMSRLYGARREYKRERAELAKQRNLISSTRMQNPQTIGDATKDRITDISTVPTSAGLNADALANSTQNKTVPINRRVNMQDIYAINYYQRHDPMEHRGTVATSSTQSLT